MGIIEFFGRSPEQEQSGRSPEQMREDAAVMYLNIENHLKALRPNLSEELAGGQHSPREVRRLMRTVNNSERELKGQLETLRKGGITDEDLRAAEESGLRRMESDIDSHEADLRQEIERLQGQLDDAKKSPQPNSGEIAMLTNTLRSKNQTLINIPNQRQGLARDRELLEAKYPTKQNDPAPEEPVE